MKKSDSKRICSGFSRSASFYNQNAVIQKKMAEHLCLLLTHYGNSFSVISELGSGTGLLTMELKKVLTWDTIHLFDLQEIHCSWPEACIHQCDLNEVAHFPDSDLIVSGATLQWISDIPALFEKIHAALHLRQGLFCFSTFALNHFQEIRSVTGLTLNYHSGEEMLHLLQKSGFTPLYMEQSLHTQWFQSPMDILKHMKKTGVNRVTVHELKNPRARIQKFCQDYERFHSPLKGYPLTWRPLYCIARA